MASEERAPAADEAMTLDEVAPRRRGNGPRRPSAGRRRPMVIVAVLLAALVGLGATVAAVAGPAPTTDVGEGVAQVADEAPATTSAAPATTLPAPTVTTLAPPEAADNADITPTDCADSTMCGDISSDGPCGDTSMCGDIMPSDDCADGEMCGEIPAPTECPDPAMCGQIVPEPVESSG